MSIGASLVFLGSVLYALGDQVKTHPVENMKSFKREMSVEGIDVLKKGKQQISGDRNSVHATQGDSQANSRSTLGNPLKGPHVGESKKDR